MPHTPYIGKKAELAMNKAESLAVGAARAIERPSTRELLEHKRVSLEKELSLVNEAIEALEADPKVYDAIQKLSRVGFGLY